MNIKMHLIWLRWLFGYGGLFYVPTGSGAHYMNTNIWLCPSAFPMLPHRLNSWARELSNGIWYSFIGVWNHVPLGFGTSLWLSYINIIIRVSWGVDCQCYYDESTFRYDITWSCSSQYSTRTGNMRKISSIWPTEKSMYFFNKDLHG